ncbi:MAG: HEAT repeat domain-containing protein, partial [Acidobacteria bacterium]|nr:HEAT repeat domain-containing protein [Acidobacteriota bacterium]
YYVVIPDADLITRDVQGLQNSLRGRGFQNVRIEKKGNDVVISFRLRPGMRARVEQKFNRLDVIFTAPPGVIFNPNQNRNTGGGVGTSGGSTTGGGTTGGGATGRPGNTSVGGGTLTAGGSAGSTGAGGTSTASSSGGGGGSGTRGRRRGSRYPGYGGGGGGGGDTGGGAPLNIPLPSAMQPEATPTATPPSAQASASPIASPGVGNDNAQANASPVASGSPTPEEIAQAQPPNTTPPQTTSTTTTAPGVPEATSSNTGFAAAIRDNWLPLLIGLLVLVAIGLLLASRSRADRDEGPERERLQTKKQETIKEKPASSTAAKVAAGTAGAAAVAAIAKERAKPTTPAAEPVKTKEEKGVEAVAPVVGMERISTEVKNLLEGKNYDDAVITSSNPETRQIVSTELLAALASRNPERRLRAREAFTKHGFFDEATQKLRTSQTGAERISAARSLGLTQDNAATPHLVAALEDEDPEVRRASVNALAELRDPSAIGPLNALLEREKNRKVPHSLIRRAIEASATIDISGEDKTAAAEGQGATATSAEKKDKDDDDREVFEI